MVLHDEIDRLERENLRRGPVTVVCGVFTLSLLKALAGASVVWAGAAVASFGVFIALMVRPIRRFQRIRALREELGLLETPSPGTSLPPGDAAP